jgi:hypothetical protein
VRGTGSDGLPASLLAIDRVAAELPEDTGAKRTVTFCRPPGATVKGAAGETTENGLEVESPVTVSGALPAFEINKVLSAVCPAVRLPKSRFVGLTTIVGALILN